jgi:hypothetical protein
MDSSVQATPSPFAVAFIDVAIRSVDIDLVRCAVMNDMDGVNALEDIRQLKAKYCRLLDTQWDGFGALFAPDAAIGIAGGPGCGRRAELYGQGSLFRSASRDHVAARGTRGVE